MRHLRHNLAKYAAFAAPMRRAAGKARCLLLFERFWRHFTPLFLLLLLFVTSCWLKLFAVAPPFVHALLLLVFAVAFGAALWFLCRLPWPRPAEITARLERDNALLYDQLGLDAELLAGAPPPAQALWREHKKRMRIAPGRLKLRPPRPNIPAYDRFGSRSFVFLLFAVAFCFQSGGRGGRLADALYFGPRQPLLLRLDAWVSPPDYTGRPPLYLLSGGDSPPDTAAAARRNSGAVPVAVPQGSLLTVRLNDNGRGLAALSCAGPGGKSRLKAQPQGAASVYQLRLEQSVKCRLTAPAPLPAVNWAFTVEPDQAPAIAWLKPPERALNGVLKLNYRIDDDYGASKAWLEIKPADEQALRAASPYFARLTAPPVISRYRGGSFIAWQGVAPDPAAAKPAPEPLSPLPQIRLNLPRPLPLDKSGRRGGEAATEADLTGNPWAGAFVTMRLVAEDSAGQRASSAPVMLVLPQKTFVNPLSRALIEQRRLLTADAQAAPQVLAMLEALLLWPEKTIADKGSALALYSLRARLRALIEPLPGQPVPAAAERRQRLADIAAYMWAIAEGIDGGRLAEAERRLALAAQALREALRNGASPAEITRLMQDLRRAMQAYVAMLAERGTAAGDNKAPKLGENALEKRLKALEEAARQGKRGQSEELLSEFEDLMKNLQVTQGGQGSDTMGGPSSKQGQMQQQMDKLSDIMRRQQQLLDDTHKSREQGWREAPGAAAPERERQSRDLQQRQEELQRDMQALQQGLEKQGLAAKEALGQAEQKMAESGAALGQNNAPGAEENQAQALQALRDGAQNIMGQMREALKKADAAQQAQQKGPAGGQGQEQAGPPDGAQDPLGRPPGSGQTGQGDFMPPEEAQQRARHILEEIRKKLGKLTPQQEKDYLERLLNFE